MKSLCLTLFLLLGLSIVGNGQVFHFIPPYISDLDAETVVLTVAQKNSDVYAVACNSTEFIITLADGTIEKFELKDNTIEQLIQAIKAKLKEKVFLHSGYLSLPANVLTVENFILSGTTSYEFKSKKAAPKYVLDFGAIYSTATQQEELSNSSLFNQTGFNFNFLGHHKFGQGTNSCFYTSYRLGFSSNTNLDVAEKSDSTAMTDQMPKDTSFTSIIKRATQASLSAQVEFILNKSKRNPFEVTFYMEGGISFNRLKAFDISNTQVRLPDGSRVNLVDTFSSSAIEMFRTQSTRPLFSGFGEAGFNFKYIKNDKLLFYGGIGAVFVPNIARVIQYQFNDDQLDKDFLEYATADLGYSWKIRPKIGFSLPNLIEIRAEAVYDLQKGSPALDRNSRENIYRIAITKDFPIK